jgi:hypothetical protein
VKIYIKKVELWLDSYVVCFLPLILNVYHKILVAFAKNTTQLL